jgi:hypothetical protein
MPLGAHAEQAHLGHLAFRNEHQLRASGGEVAKPASINRAMTAIARTLNMGFSYLHEARIIVSINRLNQAAYTIPLHTRNPR